MNDNWIDVSSGVVPDFDVNVLGFYTLPHKTGVYQYFVICHIDNASVGKRYKHYSWVDGEHNPITPTHWQPLPDPPVNLPK
jgi:hypothetical protein